MTHLYQILMRLFAIFGVAVFCIIIWFVAAITWKMPLHNYRLWRMQNHFRSTMQSVHPAQSQFIGNRLIETGVYFTDEEFFKKDCLWSEWLEKYPPDNRSATNENTHRIYSEDAMNPPDGDIRCH